MIYQDDRPWWRCSPYWRWPRCEHVGVVEWLERGHVVADALEKVGKHSGAYSVRKALTETRLEAEGHIGATVNNYPDRCLNCNPELVGCTA